MSKVCIVVLDELQREVCHAYCYYCQTSWHSPPMGKGGGKEYRKEGRRGIGLTKFNLARTWLESLLSSTLAKSLKFDCSTHLHDACGHGNSTGWIVEF